MSTVEMAVVIREKESEVREIILEQADPRKQKIASVKRIAVYEQLIRKEEK